MLHNCLYSFFFCSDCCLCCFLSPFFSRQVQRLFRYLWFVWIVAFRNYFSRRLLYYTIQPLDPSIQLHFFSHLVLSDSLFYMHALQMLPYLFYFQYLYGRNSTTSLNMLENDKKLC